MRIYFIRHAESIKAIESRHGGPGNSLTQQGKSDVLDISNWLMYDQNINSSSAIIFCSKLPQVIETVQIIVESVKIPYEITTELKNIHLGILDGLSDEEALQKYPDVAKNLELWRKGLIPIDSFTIPQSEDLKCFYQRILVFLNRIKKLKYYDIIIVGTRSVGVAVTNVLLSNNSKFLASEYKRYPFDPSSATLFSLKNEKATLIFQNKTNYLKNTPFYPDTK